MRPRHLNNKGLVSLSRRHRKLAFHAAREGFACLPTELSSWEGHWELRAVGGGVGRERWRNWQYMIIHVCRIIII